ncbi:amidohydrolase [Brevibacillus borstelensis]|uniref:MerR family transcriptional regulator n=1 Tax=Brevibacillus borstelensis AK1 TaxID=1300222 RepID=M8DB27_9BACL|nr:amidohydrolase [Brevibacillus borstelensis]EMT53504.1 merR family transcriptional regulator [Brevibacillus borstelensis AK1]KKX53108.1 amidohydrolase [Brevibacillus borstelensis cifa_chp40]
MADTVFLNGQVITVDRYERIVEAVAVSGNRISAVGTNEEVSKYIGPLTRVIDLEGKSLLPGFIDSHLHITIYGTNKLGVDCKARGIDSIEDLLEALREQASRTPEGKWVRACGFDENRMREKRFPTRRELDSVSEKHPVFVMRTCAHHSIVNTEALRRAGFDEHTPDPQGGRLDRDEQGVLTGLLVETAHMQMFEAAAFSEEEYREGLRLASEDFVAAGITSVHDAGGYGPDNLRAMQKAVQAGDVKVRIYAMICALNQSDAFVRKVIDAGIVTGLGDERFRIGPAKVFVDGASIAPTMAMREPFASRPGDSGILYYSQDELNRILIEAHEKGFQITAHAQGDRAIELLLACFEEALEKHPRQNHRHRIEHAGVSAPDLVQRMAKLGVIPTPNPAFLYEYGESYLKNLGERSAYMYPVGDFFRNGIIAAGASDCPVTGYSPLVGIHAAVNRKSRNGATVGEQQAVSVMDAIKMFTIHGAYASFEEGLKGSIEAGKLADLVVVNGRMLDVPKEAIKDLQVSLTMIDGEVVYASQEAMAK